jgi:hypothetical protein
MLTLRTSIGQLRAILLGVAEEIAWRLEILRFCMRKLHGNPFQKQTPRYTTSKSKGTLFWHILCGIFLARTSFFLFLIRAITIEQLVLRL